MSRSTKQKKHQARCQRHADHRRDKKRGAGQTKRRTKQYNLAQKGRPPIYPRSFETFITRLEERAHPRKRADGTPGKIHDFLKPRAVRGCRVIYLDGKYQERKQAA